MTDDIIWKETESGSGFNTAIAAGATEQIVAAPQRVDAFNTLLVVNRDAVDFEIQPDGATSGGKILQVPSGGAGGIDPDKAIWFKQIVIKNLDTATAATANKLFIRWAKSVPKNGV